jgi:beta-mannosidase
MLVQSIRSGRCSIDENPAASCIRRSVVKLSLSQRRIPSAAQVMPHSIFEAVSSAQDGVCHEIYPDQIVGPSLRMPVESLSGLWHRAPLEESIDGSDPGLDDSDWAEVSVPDSYGADPALSRYFGPVWYRRRIRLSRPPEDLLRPVYYDLVFDGADYFCEAYLDGQTLGLHEGYAAPFRFDVSELVSDGSLLAAKVVCPLEELDADAFFISHRKNQIKGVLSYHDSRPGGLPGATTPGWTSREGQSYPTGGITAPVTLRATGPLRLDAIFVTPLDTRGNIHIAVVITNRTSSSIAADLALHLSSPRGGYPEGSVIRFEAAPGPSRLDFDADVGSPVVWQAASEGMNSEAAPLYSIGASLLIDGKTSDVRRTRFGIRVFGVSASQEAWSFALNGSQIPIKGANYIPLQHFAKASREIYNTDIELARRASLNSLGIHAHIQPEAFYDAADDAGILVFQDFSLQWTYDSGKSSNPGFVDRACRMASEMVYRLWNHPSVVYWCAHNEPPYIWFSSESKPEPQNDLDNQALDMEVKRTIEDIDPTRYVHLASGIVDSHRYEGSLSGGHLADFCDSPSGFVSEYGFWSAAFSSARYGDSGWPPDDATLEKWASRLSFFGSTSTYVGAPSRYSCFQDWAYATQRYQAFVLKFMTEWMRSWRSRGLGGYRMHFLLDWGGYAGGGLLDKDRRPKLAYDWLAKANAEVLVAALIRRTFIDSPGQERIELWAFSDSPKRQALDIEWSLAEATSFEVITSDPEAAVLGGTGIAAPPRARVVIPRGTKRGHLIRTDEAHFGLEPFGCRKFAELIISTEDARFSVPKDSVPKAFVLDAEYRWGEGSGTNWAAFAVAPRSWDAGPGMWPAPRFNLEIGIPGRGRGIRLGLYRRHSPEQGPLEADTDAFGKVRFEGLPPDEYDLEVAGIQRRIPVVFLEDMTMDIRL